MVECRPTGTFLSIIPSQSAMNLSQDEDLSTTYLFSSFLLAVLQEACLPKFHTMLGFRIDSFRIFFAITTKLVKVKQNVELSNSPVKHCNLHPTIGKLLWF